MTPDMQVVSERLNLTRNGPDSYTGCCPFHDEQEPSLHIRPSTGTYYCFGCGAKGYLQDLAA